MVLQRPGHDFGGAGAEAVNQHHHGEVASLVAAAGVMMTRGLGAPLVEHDQLVLLQEHVRHRHPFLEQPARVPAQVEDQSIQLVGVQILQCGRQLLVGVLVEAGQADVAHAGLDLKVKIHAVAGNLIPGDGELQRLVVAFAQHLDLDHGALGPLEQVGHLAGA